MKACTKVETVGGTFKVCLAELPGREKIGSDRDQFEYTCFVRDIEIYADNKMSNSCATAQQFSAPLPTNY